MNDDEYDEYTDEAVFITKGHHKGHIGYCDGLEGRKAIIHFGHLFLTGYFAIPLTSIRIASMNDLMERLSDIQNKLMRHKYRTELLDEEEQIDLLHELYFIFTKASDRHFFEAFKQSPDRPKKIFLSHASPDKGYVRRVYNDLINRGYGVWLDEYEIKAGESIPSKIQQGITECEHVIVFLSKNSVKSSWVETEWMAKFHKEIASGKNAVITALIQECEIPLLLQNKKYANFVEGYNDGLLDILRAIE